MRFDLAHLVETAERNAAESRAIADAQRALVENLGTEGRAANVAREILRAAQATQAMFEAHLDQLKRLSRVPRPRAGGVALHELAQLSLH